MFPTGSFRGWNMVDAGVSENELTDEAGNPDMEKKLAAIGWGAFFAWLGLVLLMKVGSGIVLLGIGVITLGMQGVRKYYNLDLERFWLVCGAIFLAGGIWELAQLDLPFVPIVLVLLGAVLIGSAFRKKPG